MSIANYAELQTAILNWLARDGDAELTARAPDFIQLCEARLKRNLRVREMEERDIAVLTSRYLALPDGFLEMRRLHLALDDGSTATLRYETPYQLKASYPENVTGRPRIYTVIERELEVSPTPDIAYPLEMAYYIFLPLGPTQASNWLLAAYPDIYLFGALVEARGFIQDATQAAAWQARFDLALAELSRADANARWSGAPLTARTDTGNP